VAHAVKISEPEMEVLREAAAINSRSISGQAEHWLRIGRAVERDPRFGYVRIEQALKGLLGIDDLDGDEQEEFMDRLGDQLRAPSSNANAFYADRNRRGVGVGMDEAGNLEYPPNAKK
jgi:hypothetical protein